MLPGAYGTSYGTHGGTFQWIRADYFCKYLLGDFDQSVDMWELNNERQAAEKVAPVRQGTQQQVQRRGGGGN